MDPDKEKAEQKSQSGFDAEATGEMEPLVQPQEKPRDSTVSVVMTDFDAEAADGFGFMSDFFSKNDQLADDSLEVDRKLDMERLAPIISDNRGFEQKILDAPVDPVVAEKLQQYEAEKDANAAPKEAFYEDVGLKRDMEADSERLTEQQMVLLQTVQKLSDDEMFREQHPELKSDESIRPTRIDAVEYEPPPIPDLTHQPQQPVAEIGSSFDGVGVQANLTYEKMQVLTGEKESMDLITRDTKGAIVTVDRDSLFPRRAPMSTEVKIAIGLVALAIPLFSWSIYVQSRANAEADNLQASQSVALAETAADAQSIANKMEEPYRMPAGANGPTGAPNAEGSSSGSGQAGYSPGDLANWKPPANPSPAPSPLQLEEDRRIMAMAEQMVALGNSKHAAFLLNAGLGKAPGDIALVLATARAYIAIRDYGTARRILQASMRGARSLADYSLLQSLLMQLPAES